MIDRVAQPYKIHGIDHVVLCALNAYNLVAFYRDVVGCQIIWDRPDIGLTHLQAGNAIIDIISIDGPLGKEGVSQPDGYGRNVDHICILIDPFDFETLQSYFATHKVTISSPELRFGAVGYSSSIYLKDPEGNGIELKALTP